MNRKQKLLAENIIYVVATTMLAITFLLIPKIPAKATELEAPVEQQIAYTITQATYESPKIVHKSIVVKKFVITAYCPCYICCQKLKSDPFYGITATMVKAIEGVTCAVDSNIIPYGTRLYIDGVGERTAQDTFSKKVKNTYNGTCIDVYFEKHVDAVKFGKKLLEVQIIE